MIKTKLRTQTRLMSTNSSLQFILNNKTSIILDEYQSVHLKFILRDKRKYSEPSVR